MSLLFHLVLSAVNIASKLRDPAIPSLPFPFYDHTCLFLGIPPLISSQVLSKDLILIGKIKLILLFPMPKFWIQQLGLWILFCSFVMLLPRVLWLSPLSFVTEEPISEQLPSWEMCMSFSNPIIPNKIYKNYPAGLYKGVRRKYSCCTGNGAVVDCIFYSCTWLLMLGTNQRVNSGVMVFNVEYSIPMCLQVRDRIKEHECNGEKIVI